MQTYQETYQEDDLADLASRDDVLSALDGVRDELRAMLGVVKAELAMSLAEALDARIDGRVAACLADFKRESAEVRGCFDAALARLEAVVRALPRPEVTVNVPEAGVTVNVPPRKVTKRITYDANGRPESVIEEEG